MSEVDLSQYDDLECPQCGEVCKPKRVSKSRIVTYVCDECGSFRIDKDGDLIE